MEPITLSLIYGRFASAGTETSSRRHSSVMDVADAAWTPRRHQGQLRGDRLGCGWEGVNRAWLQTGHTDPT